MADYLFDQQSAKRDLNNFFSDQKNETNDFGRTVNQTFEAHILAKTIKWYKTNGWRVEIKNPIINKKEVFKLKFNTRGKPSNYSYIVCSKGQRKRQIRHGLRVQTRTNKRINFSSANIVCDIAVMEDLDIDYYSTDTALPNENLIAFGEVKHMSAFAELIAGFIGMVHELKPEKLKRLRIKNWNRTDEISCFLYVSGILYTTAKGMVDTIDKRKYDIDVYSIENEL